MQNEKNNFIKILIILVIASLALLAIVYVMNKSMYSDNSFVKINQVLLNNEEKIEERYDFFVFGEQFSYEGDGGVVIDLADHVTFYDRSQEELLELLDQGVDNKSVIYVMYNDQLHMSRNLYSISGIFKGFDPSKINYKCDGTFMKFPGGMSYLKETVDPKRGDFNAKIISIDDDDRWAFCETNGKDYLKQFEFGTINGEYPLFTGGGENVSTWNLIYSKKLDDVNYFFSIRIGDTHFFYSDENIYSPQDYCLEDDICYDKSSKEYLKILLAGKELQKKIAEWDKFVESIELVK